MQQFIKKNLEPRIIEIAGEVYPAIFSFAALADIEEALNLPHAAVFNRLASGETHINDLAVIVCSCMRAAGVDVAETDFMLSVDAADYENIIEQIIEIIAPESNSKKAKAKNVSK